MGIKIKGLGSWWWMIALLSVASLVAEGSNLGWSRQPAEATGKPSVPCWKNRSM